MKQEIVVLRLSSLGDVAMILPCFLAMQRSHPDVQIHFITQGIYSPIFDSLTNVKIHSVAEGQGKPSWYELIKIAWKIHQLKPDCILDLHDVIRTKIITSVHFLLGHKIKKITKNRSQRKLAISLNKIHTISLKPVIEQYTDVFRHAGFDIQASDLVLPKQKVNAHRVSIGIAPFAKFKSKQYELSKMKEVANDLACIDHSHLYIFGHGEEEKQLSQRYFGEIVNCSILIDQMDLKEELNIISSLDLMISMDSGNGHLATNFGVPVLTIWGVTHPCLGFKPYRQPTENSILPDQTIFPNLPVSVYGTGNLHGYDRAIDSIVPARITARVKSILDIA